MTSLSRSSWTVIVFLFWNLLLAPLLVDSSSSASSPPPPTPSYNNFVKSGSASWGQSSESQKIQAVREQPHQRLFDFHRSNTSIGSEVTGDEIIIVRKSDGSKERLQETKVKLALKCLASWRSI
jgi:hypothetical protein